MKLSRLFVVFALLTVCFGYFAVAEDAPTSQKMSSVSIMKKISPYVIAVKDLDPNAKEENEEEANPMARFRRQRSAYESWRMGLLISTDVAMYPFTKMLRQYRKTKMGEDEIPAAEVVLANGKTVAGLEIGMNIEASLAFAQVAMPEGFEPKALDWTKKTTASVGEQVCIVGRRGEEWSFEPFFLETKINGKLVDKKTQKTFYSLALSQTQLQTEALGAIVAKANGEVLGVISRVEGKRYSIVVTPISEFTKAIEVALKTPEELEQFEDLPDMPQFNRRGNAGGGDNGNGRRPGGQRPDRAE